MFLELSATLPSNKLHPLLPHEIAKFTHKLLHYDSVYKMQFHLDSKQMVYRWILIDLVPLNSNWPDKSTRKKKKLRKLSTEKKQQHFFFFLHSMLHSLYLIIKS